jgi:Cupredoxin-like domain
VSRRRRSRWLGVALLILVSCSSSRAATGPPLITIGSDDPNAPYGIVAINYHFHDAHPSIPLATTRTVLWVNEGTVKHNVTFPELGFSKDIQVGQTIRIKDLGQKLGGPGTYTFYCKYHEALGMVGTIIIK